jgi:CRISPR-associated protein Cas5h
VKPVATVFEVTGPVAMFRKPYTTTSAVSFAFPPPTAIAGMIAAIIGLGNGSDQDATNAEYWSYMRGTRIAIRIAAPIRWKNHSVNLWNTKNPQRNPRVQVKHQFVGSPRYRVYVSGGLEEKLRSFIESETFIYTPCLGTAYAIADLQYIGFYPWSEAQEDVLEVDTVLPWDEGVKIDALRSGGAFREIVPFELDQERGLVESVTVLYPTAVDRKLHLLERGVLDVTRCGDDVVAWFPAW